VTKFHATGRCKKEGAKEGYPLKRHFTIIGLSSMKIVADRHRHQWQF